jgi:hypothetical protein
VDTREESKGETTIMMGDDAAPPDRSSGAADSAASRTISEMVRRIVAYLQPERVILFGS